MLLHLLRSSWRARLEPSRSSPRILRAGRMLQRRPPNFKAIGQHCIADAAPCPATGNRPLKPDTWERPNRRQAPQTPRWYASHPSGPWLVAFEDLWHTPTTAWCLGALPRTIWRTSTASRLCGISPSGVVLLARVLLELRASQGSLVLGSEV